MTVIGSRPDNAAEIRKRAEELVAQIPEDPGMLSSEKAQQLLHELHVHQIELEMQNEELRRAQVELDASRARYFDLYNLAPVGYLSISEQGLILEINLTAATLLGAARSALVRRRLSSFILPDDQDIYYLHRRQLFETGTRQVCEFRMLRPNAPPFWVRFEATLAPGETGSPICLATMSDITELRRKEEELQTLHLRQETILASVPDIIMEVDSNKRYVWANQAGLEFFGEDVVGKEASFYFIGEQRTYETVQPLFEGHEETFYLESWQRCKDGQKRLLSWWCRVLKDEFGMVSGAISTARDITDIRSANEERERVVELSTDLICVAGLDGYFKSVNPAWTRILGYSQEELLTRPFLDFIHPDDHHKNDEEVSKLADGLMTVNFDNRYVHKDGSVRYISWTATPRPTEGVMYCIGRDITERRRALEALRLKNLVFDRSMAANSIADTNGALTECNETFVQMWGYSKKEECIGKSIVDMLKYPSEATAILASLDAVGECEREYTALRKDGSDFNAYGLATILRDEMGRTIGYQSSVLDITERKRAESIAQARLRLLEFASSHSMDELLTSTLDELEALTGSTIGFYHFVETDQSTLSLQSWSTNTLKHMCTAAGKGNHYDVAKAGVWVDCVRERRPVIHNDYASLPHRKGMPEGHASVVRELVVPILRGNLIKAIIGVGNKSTNYDEGDLEAVSQLGDLSWDITERVRAEQALRESEEKYRLVSEYTNDWVYWIAPDETLRYVSPSCERVTGYAPEEFESNPGLTLEIVHAVDRGAIGRHLSKVELSDVPDSMEFRIITKTGEVRWIDHHCRPIYTEAGAHAGRRGTNRDITDRRRAEDELRQLNAELDQRVAERTEQLEATNRELEAFSYSVSHDLRAPLRGMDGFSQILLEDYADQLDDIGKEHLQRIRAASHRMSQLIDDMLALSRTSRCEMSLGVVDLSAMATDIFRELQSSQPERQVEFLVTPGLKAKADSNLIRIALVNLLSNAWKFTSRHTTAKIELGIMPDPTGVLTENADQVSKGHATFFVRDDGAGFDMVHASKLFGAFQRLHPAEEFAGTGIGLATVQRVIHRHGGRVWAEAGVEQGATIYFTIPQQ